MKIKEVRNKVAQNLRNWSTKIDGKSFAVQRNFPSPKLSVCDGVIKPLKASFEMSYENWEACNGSDNYLKHNMVLSLAESLMCKDVVAVRYQSDPLSDRVIVTAELKAVVFSQGEVESKNMVLF